MAVLLAGLMSSGCGNDNNNIRTDDDITGSLVSSSGGFSGFVAVDSSFFDDHIPQVAFDGTNYLVVYEEVFSSTDHNIIGALVSPTGMVLSYIEIDVTTNDDRAPRVAFDGTNYLVVYEETVTSTNHDIIGARVDPNPSAVVPVLGYVNIDVSANDDRAPRVAFDGTNYLVVYEETVTSTNHDIIGVFVSPGGVPGIPFAIDNSTNDDRAPAVTFGGGNYMVVYQETVTGTDHNIIGKQVTPAGSVGSAIAIDTSGSDDRVPAVAFDGTNYLVVYEEDATVTISNHDIWAAFVSTAGAPGTPFAIDNTSNDDVAPAVTFTSGGGKYLVAYQETFTSTDHDIIGNQVDPSGVVGGAIAIDTTRFDTVAPAVASDGTNYFVVYEDVF